MKNFLNLSLIVLLFISTGCDKEKRAENRLEGTWELHHRDGGYVPVGTPSDFPTGNGDIYRFGDETFEHQRDGKLVESGKFLVVEERSNPNGEELEFKLVLNGRSDQATPFKLSGKKLMLHFGNIASDGTILTYTHIR
jgi:hypothetical protein